MSICLERKASHLLATSLDVASLIKHVYSNGLCLHQLKWKKFWVFLRFRIGEIEFIYLKN